MLIQRERSGMKMDSRCCQISLQLEWIEFEIANIYPCEQKNEAASVESADASQS